MMLRLVILGAAFGSAQLQASMSWSSQIPQSALPEKSEAASHGGHGHGGHRSGKPFYLQQAQGAEAEVWFPTLVRRPLNVNEQGVVKLSSTGVNNYHLLYARRKGEASDEVALRYHYLNGKPTGESPRRLLSYRKAALDIVPSPLTREHQRYYSGRVASYTLLFKNRPLASQELVVTTSNGTSLKLKSDEAGRVVVAIPEDFDNIKAGRRANRPAEFVLSASYNDQGVAYSTTLSADYHVNPSHWQSNGGGLLAMLAGFAGGLLVIRRQRKRAQESDNA